MEGLLFLEMPKEAVEAIVGDIVTELGRDMYTILANAECEGRVIGVLAERRMAGEVKPNVMEAIMLAGCSSEVETVIRKRDKMSLSQTDVFALAKHTTLATSEMGERRLTNRYARRSMGRAQAK